MNSMMDVNAYKFIQNVSHQPQMHEMGLHQGSLQEGDSIDALYKESKMRCSKDFLRNKIAKNLNQNTNLQLGKLTSDRVPDLQSQLSVNGASKEYMNQKMLACQLQNMIQHEIRDGSFSSQQVARHATSSFGNLNSPHALIDCSMFISTDCSLRTNSANDSSFFNDGSFGFSKGSACGDYNQGVATAFMAFDGARMLSPAGIRQVSSEMVPSSEQISSITVCSDTDVYSNAVPFDDGPTFPGNSLQHLSGLVSENNIPQQHLNEREMNVIKHGRFLENNQNVYTVGVSSLLGGNLELPFPNFQNLQQDRQMIPEASGILTRAIFDTPMSTCEDLLQPKQLMPGTQLFHQPHQQPYVQFDESSEDQSRNSLFEDDECINKITGKKAFNVSSLPSKQSHGVQYVALESSSILLGPTGAAKPAHSSDLMFRFLLSYMNYKTTHVDGSQVSFIKHMHSTVCNDCTCNCDQYFMFLSHFDNCHCWECNICRLVRRSCVTGKPPQRSGKQENGRLNAFCDNDFSCTSPHPSEDIQHPSKRLKMGNHVSFEIGVSDVVACSMTQPCEPQQLPHLQQWPEACESDNLDATKVNMEVSTPLWESTSTSSTGNNVTETAQMSNLKSIPIHPQELVCCSKEEETVPTCTSEVRNNVADNFRIFNSCSVSVPSEELTADHKEGKKEVRTKSDKAKLEAKSDFIALSADSGMKSVEPKILGESLINSFTVEEMKEHLSSLRQFIGQEVKGNTKAHSVGEKSCQLCSMDKLVFAPAPIYCSSCGARIKLNLIYHCALDKMGTQHCFCNSCFKGSHGREISFHGISISKAKFHKERINHEDEESWVQCDKCRGWQHQICALYNNKSNLGGKSEYVCPKCYLEGIEVGEHVPLPKTVAFGAKDLPTTTLSDYIEQRLFRCLMQDSEERAKALQKKLDEVPRAANLAVRVVLSVKKLLKVKQQFLDIFHNEKYPTEFPYRSKVILLFQRIEGVDVCLFGMYVQEYGSECSHPNQRCVYISYLDSVKYFRPEIKTASGEALRTFVYHQILIGYLDYCKKRGFATCYIWACPPVRGEDYILYCHPETQKTPKSDKLRQWYKSMLRKAIKENIVVDCTNLYDHFFVPTGEHNMKITAARLPYFDGDYLSGAAVDMIKNIEQRSQVGSQSKVKKALTKRTLKAMGHTSLSDDATKDILLMKNLEQTISPVKEDFIMVHLQFTCTCCHEVILSGSQWICNECKNFQLCARCHDVEQTLNEGNTHTSSSGEKHSLSQVVVKDVPVNTEDTDVIIDNGYFENRHSFLSFCQGNHYQFDTLRHVKHSSMMILYHLHNPTKQSVGTSCCICHQDIVVNQGWHCEICPRFDACDGCYHRKGDDCHIHKLSQCSSVVNCGSKNGQTQQQKSTQMREILDVLMHASQCNVTKSSICSYPNCVLERCLSQSEQIRTLQDQLLAADNKLQMSDLSALETRTEFEEQKKLIHDLQCRLAVAEVKIIEGENLRKKLHNTILELKGNIRVFCRVRPLLPDDGVGTEAKVFSYPTSTEALGRSIDLIQNGDSGQKHSFTFDKVFMPDASQEDVFVEISQLVQSALDGYKVCIFAYGQTGSGKTYTMMGRPGNPFQKGLIPRSLEQIFQTRQSLQSQGWKYEMQVSMLEIYNETIRDLLSVNRPCSDVFRTENGVLGKQYAIKHDANGNTHVSDLTIVDVRSSREVSFLLDQAAQSRSVGKTQMNEHSSRSHFVFTLRISGVNESTEQQVQGVLNLIDLAGSERLSKSGSTGDRLKETQAINKSLSSLSDVIFALAKKEDHVPFRHSKLTYLLQPCLGGDSKTLMFVNISPDPSSMGESLCSLRFAARVNACEIGIPRRQTNMRSSEARLSYG